MARELQRQLDPEQYIVLTNSYGLAIEREPLTCRIPDLAVFASETLRRDRAEKESRDPYIWKAP